VLNGTDNGAYFLSVRASFGSMGETGVMRAAGAAPFPSNAEIVDSWLRNNQNYIDPDPTCVPEGA
jgi:hypothetical protein